MLNNLVNNFLILNNKFNILFYNDISVNQNINFFKNNKTFDIETIKLCLYSILMFQKCL